MVCTEKLNELVHDNILNGTCARLKWECTLMRFASYGSKYKPLTCEDVSTIQSLITGSLINIIAH